MQDNTAIPFPHPQLTAEDPLTAVLRQGAQRLLAQAFGRALTPLGLFVAAWIATVVTAVASWYLVERPALSLKQPSRSRPVVENTSPGHFRTGEVGL